VVELGLVAVMAQWLELRQKDERNVNVLILCEENNVDGLNLICTVCKKRVEERARRLVKATS
jgi:hypothetical protein